MEETTIVSVAVDFLSSMLGTVGRVFSTIAFWWIAYVLLRYFLQNVVYKDNDEGWKAFKENIRLGVYELSVTFHSSMSAVALIAKQWAEEKFEDYKDQISN